MKFFNMVMGKSENSNSSQTAKERLLQAKSDSCSDRVIEIKKIIHSKLLEINTLRAEDILITSSSTDINVNITI